ncbi:MAG: apolipoprotein N-acyltransferase [Armatimonadota bacterium]
MNIIRNKKLSILWMLLSIILLIPAFPKLNWFLFAWFALIPFILVLHNIDKWKAFWYGWLAGVLFTGVIFRWLYPVAAEGYLAGLIIFSFSFALFSFITAYFYQKTNPGDYWIRLIFTPCAYILTAEYLKTLKPLGIACGLLYSSQYKFLPVLQIADIAGSFAVSWLIVFFNTFLAEIILLIYLKKKIKPAHLIIPPVIIILCIIYGFFKMNVDYRQGDPFKVSIIQPNISQNIKWDKRYADTTLIKLFGMTTRASFEKPDLIIWPETAVPDIYAPKSGLFIPVIRFAQLENINLLTGGLYYENKGLYNAAFLIEPGKEDIQKYAKMRLFPMGEYNPLEGLLPKMKILEKIGRYKEGKDQTIFKAGEAKFPVLICFESVFSYISRDAVLKGANALTVITNDELFRRTGAAEQHIALSLPRCIENRVYMVFAANTGYSAFIDPAGRVYEISGLFEEAALTNNIYLPNKESIFTRFGEWFLLLSLIVAMVLIIIVIRKSRRC